MIAFVKDSNGLPGSFAFRAVANNLKSAHGTGVSTSGIELMDGYSEFEDNFSTRCFVPRVALPRGGGLRLPTPFRIWRASGAAFIHITTTGKCWPCPAICWTIRKQQQHKLLSETRNTNIKINRNENNFHLITRCDQRLSPESDNSLCIQHFLRHEARSWNVYEAARFEYHPI